MYIRGNGRVGMDRKKNLMKKGSSFEPTVAETSETIYIKMSQKGSILRRAINSILSLHKKRQKISMA